MAEDLRTLLDAVAAGSVDPHTAASRLDAMDLGRDRPETVDEDPWAAATGAERAPGEESRESASTARGAGARPGDEPVELIRVQASARPVRVVADHTVATLVVEGPHNVRREGGLLRVDAPVAAGADPSGSYRYERKTGLSRWISQATLFGVPLTVRINPAIPLELEVMAGSLTVVGMAAAVTATVTAGSLRASDCTGPVSATVRAGSARLEVRPHSGRSSLRVESGSVDVRLQPGSDVRIRARAELGEVKVKSADGRTVRVVDREGSHEVVLGAGTAELEIEALMGSVTVRTP